MTTIKRQAGVPLLSKEFWDCECNEHYIHHNSERFCDACGSDRELQPPSRVDEVNRADYLEEN